ncbi:MAG: WD40/YVTN/BNR-like repeat-containing protein [Actinomycetota bacterium]
MIWDLYAVNGDTAWAVGKDGLGAVKAYRTMDGGLSWEGFPAATDPAGKYQYLRIQALSERKAWAYGYERQQYGMFIRRTLDGGSSWKTVCSREGKNPLDMEILDQDRFWLVGVEMVVVPSPDPGGNRTFIDGFVERSWDGGATWTRQFDYPFAEYMGPHDRTANYFPYSFDLEAVDSTTAWVGIYNRLLRTEDAGLHWVPQLEAPGPVTLRVSAMDSRTAWLA